MECKHHMIVILFQKDMLGWWQLSGASLSSIILTHDMIQQTHISESYLKTKMGSLKRQDLICSKVHDNFNIQIC